jgi:Leucine-rich repeat (LRR) protein|tara:strand:- start:111 stop:557 length:447 start_codon:yes stop_codon:yes gene_type:complete
MKKLLLIALLIFGCSTEPEDCVELLGECYNIKETDEIYLTGGRTGEIPSTIGDLTNLTSLNIYNNQLTGEIPSEIGNLTNLTKLFLYENNLTGSIPPEIGNLTNLTAWSLNDNQLTGDIPQAVCDLIESNNLDISDILNGNNLTNTCD